MEIYWIKTSDTLCPDMYQDTRMHGVPLPIPFPFGQVLGCQQFDLDLWMVGKRFRNSCIDDHFSGCECLWVVLLATLPGVLFFIPQPKCWTGGIQTE